MAGTVTSEYTPDIPELRAAFLTVAELNGHTGTEWEAAFNRALQRIRDDAIQTALEGQD
jgi:hypothetical protein